MLSNIEFKWPRFSEKSKRRKKLYAKSEYHCGLCILMLAFSHVTCTIGLEHEENKPNMHKHTHIGTSLYRRWSITNKYCRLWNNIGRHNPIMTIKGWSSMHIDPQRSCLKFGHWPTFLIKKNSNNKLSNFVQEIRIDNNKRFRNTKTIPMNDTHKQHKHNKVFKNN